MDQNLRSENVLCRYAEGPARLEAALAGLTEAQLDLTLAAGGWSIRQIAHHVVDGDDLWKTPIKAALGCPSEPFSLLWYWDHPQDEWAERWTLYVSVIVVRSGGRSGTR